VGHRQKKGSSLDTFSQTIKNAGINETSAKNLQLEARATEPEFRRYIAECKDQEQEVTAVGLRKVVLRERARAERAKQPRKR
jgi:hypothetical protein